MLVIIKFKTQHEGINSCKVFSILLDEILGLGFVNARQCFP